LLSIVNFYRHITPITDATHDIGINGKRWRNLRLSGNIVIDGLVDGVDVSEHVKDPNAHHKKPEISSLDPSWRGTVAIPFSTKDDPASPVLKRYGPILTTGYKHPCIRRTEDKWYLFCISDDATEVGIRESLDGISWEPYVTLFTREELGVDRYLWCPGAFYDVHLGRWMLYFDSYDTVAGRVNYYSYCDADPMVKANWSVPQAITLPNRITGTINIPRPIKLGRMYYIAYINDPYVVDTTEISARQVVWSYSRDGVNWIFGGLLLVKGGAEDWDGRLIHSFGLAYMFGVFYLIYCGYSDVDLKYRIGNAYRVADLFNLATKLFTNPILDYAPNNVAFPSLIGMEEDFRIYYLAWGPEITTGLYYAQIT